MTTTTHADRPTRASRPGTRWTPAQIAEVLDALRHRQREVPGWVLAEAAAARGESVRHPTVDAERALVADRLPVLLRPDDRAVVAIGAASALAAAPLVDALRARGATQHVVDGDPTLALALPAGMPGPRCYVCAANTLGRFGTIGAVRLLRVVRAALRATDRLLLGLDLRHERGVLEDEEYDDDGARAAIHLGVLALLGRELDADFDARHFAYRATYDDEACRVDTCLVARRTVRVAMARHGTLVLRAGESIRTAVDRKFDRARIAAMLGGVGLELASWITDDAARHAIAVAVPGRVLG
jgi:Histidine-specific methyltransferase, SAM-dependent